MIELFEFYSDEWRYANIFNHFFERHFYHKVNGKDTFVIRLHFDFDKISKNDAKSKYKIYPFADFTGYNIKKLLDSKFKNETIMADTILDAQKIVDEYLIKLNKLDFIS